MVNLTRIYTRTGDDGTTSLGDMSRTGKNDLRLVAYADVDEANSRPRRRPRARRACPTDVGALLARVQNELFDVGADLCTPVRRDPEYPPLRVDARTTSTRSRPPATSTTPAWRSCAPSCCPAAPPGSALLHVARTVVRRAERATWAALGVHGETMNPLTATYLNRLSDLLFILAREANLERRAATCSGSPAATVSAGAPAWRPLPALERPELLAEPVHAGLTSWARSEPRVAAEVRVVVIDPASRTPRRSWRRTPCAPEQSVNCVVVVGRRDGEERIAAVAVQASTRADVNNAVKRLLDVRKATFLSTERATAESSDGVRRHHPGGAAGRLAVPARLRRRGSRRDRDRQRRTPLQAPAPR